MNRFRKLGFVEYDRRIRVNKSLLNVILHDRLPDDNTVEPDIQTFRPVGQNAQRI
jgi:CRP/FNR family transcriptional regulator, cyclic AMP receptor protein